MLAVGAVRAAGLVLLGMVTGVAAVAVHGRWWGLGLATVTVAAVLVGLGPGWTTRLPFGLGFAGVAGLLTLDRPEGDFLVAGNAQGYLVLLLALAVALVAVVTLPRRPGPERRRRNLPADT